MMSTNTKTIRSAIAATILKERDQTASKPEGINTEDSQDIAHILQPLTLPLFGFFPEDSQAFTDILGLADSTLPSAAVKYYLSILDHIQDRTGLIVALKQYWLDQGDVSMEVRCRRASLLFASCHAITQIFVYEERCQKLDYPHFGFLVDWRASHREDICQLAVQMKWMHVLSVETRVQLLR